MFATLAAALLFGLLIEAEGLRTWADRLGVGTLRDSVQPVAVRWHEWLSPLQITQPRTLALQAKQQWALFFAPSAPYVPDQSVVVQHQVQSAPPSITASVPASIAPPEKSKTKRRGSAPAQAVLVSEKTPDISLNSERVMQIALAGDSMMAVGAGAHPDARFGQR